jgi:hypothetical protein
MEKCPSPTVQQTHISCGKLAEFELLSFADLVACPSPSLSYPDHLLYMRHLVPPVSSFIHLKLASSNYLLFLANICLLA